MFIPINFYQVGMFILINFYQVGMFIFLNFYQVGIFIIINFYQVGKLFYKFLLGRYFLPLFIFIDFLSSKHFLFFVWRPVLHNLYDYSKSLSVV